MTNNVLQPPPKRSPSSMIHIFYVVVGLLATSSMLGCGVERYEARLEKTSRYYEYVDRLNRHLIANPYNAVGISCRLPKQFVEIKQNPKQKDRDNRQPDFLRTMLLDGLAAAYQADLPVAMADGKTENKPCFIYLMTNSFRWKGYRPNSGMPDPLKFIDDFNQKIGAELNQNSLNIVSETFPPDKEKEFGLQKTFNLCTIIPKENFHGVSTEFKFLSYKEGDVQAIALFVTPVQVSGAEKLHEAIPLAMHTFEAVRFTFPVTGNKGEGAPRAPGTGF